MMKKILKYIAYAVGAVVLLALLLVLTLPLWLGPVVKPAVGVVVPKITGTSFELGHLYLNPYTGRLEVGGLVLGNPPGYSEPVAVSLDSLVFDAAMTTLCDKYVHIEEVTVDGLFASYLDGGEHDVDNFTQIRYNVAGSKERFEEAKRRSELKEAEAEAVEEAEEAADEVSGRKFVIDRLTIKNVKVRYGLVTIPVPVDVVLTDIGKESGGATIPEICEQAWKAILKSAGAVGDGIKAVGAILGEQGSRLGSGVSNAAGSVAEGAKNAAGSVTEGAKKATDSVTEGAKKAAENVKKLLNF